MNHGEKNFAGAVGESTSEATGKFSAFVRGDDGNLHIRHFDTAAEAAAVNSRHEDLPSVEQIQIVCGRRGGFIKSTVLARKIGVSGRTIRRAFDRGDLPGAKEHGERILLVPEHVHRLIIAYGLRGVGRMAKAGLI